MVPLQDRLLLPHAVRRNSEPYVTDASHAEADKVTAVIAVGSSEATALQKQSEGAANLPIVADSSLDTTMQGKLDGAAMIFNAEEEDDEYEPEMPTYDDDDDDDEDADFDDTHSTKTVIYNQERDTYDTAKYTFRFKDTQKVILESEYKHDPTPTISRDRDIASRIGCTELQVRVCIIHFAHS